MASSIPISPTISIGEDELQFSFVRASGPGGQNVNKVSTAVQLRFDVRNSPSLPEHVRQRLLRQARNRITDEGVLVIEARQYRTQERNRQEAVERLAELVRRAAEKPKIRKKTRPSPEAVQRRLDEKRRRSGVKRLRRMQDIE